MIRPPGPVGVTAARSTPSSWATRRTSGVACTLPPWLGATGPGDGPWDTAVAGASATGVAPSSSAPITTSTAPTGAISPSATRMRETRPAAGEGISTVVLSVWISTSGWSSAISSPTRDEPARHLALGQPLAQVGQLERVRHGGGAYLRGRPTQAPGGHEQDAQALTRAPERDGLLVARQLRRDLARHVARLQRPLLVPDADRVRVVLVLRLGDERQARAGIERRRPRRPRRETRHRRRGRRGSARPPSSRAHRSPRREGGTPRRAGRARARGEAARSTPGVVAQHGVNADLPVHDLRHAQVDDDAREAECVALLQARAPGPISATMPSTAIFAARPRCSSKPNVSHAPSMRAHGHSSARSSRRSSVSCAVRRALDRRAAHLAVALRRMPVARREERAVDRDRQVQRRARDELLAVDVAALRARRDRRVHAVPDRRHARARRGTGAASPRDRSMRAPCRRRAPSRCCAAAR